MLEFGAIMKLSNVGQLRMSLVNENNITAVLAKLHLLCLLLTEGHLLYFIRDPGSFGPWLLREGLGMAPEAFGGHCFCKVAVENTMLSPMDPSPYSIYLRDPRTL